MSNRGNSAGPARQSDSLADVVEMLLDKGVVINADIVVSVGDTELLGVQLRAAIASFETAAEYGLEFPDGTDMRRVEQASGRSELEDDETIAVEGSEEEALDNEESDTDRQSAPELGARPNASARAGNTTESDVDGESDGQEEAETEEGDDDD